MVNYKVPDQSPLAAERIDSWCRELTDLTGLAFVAWAPDGQFWMPAGFSTTLVGLVARTPSLRRVMQDQVAAVFQSGQATSAALTAGLICLAAPVRRRRMSALVVATVVLESVENRAGAAAYLAAEAGVLEAEVSQRLAGEPAFDRAARRRLAGLVARFGEEYVRRLEAEDEISQVSQKLSDGYEEITLYQRMAGKIRVSEPSDAFFMTTSAELLEFLKVEGLAALYRDTETKIPRMVAVGAAPLEENDLLGLYRHYERELMDGREAIIANDCGSSEHLRRLAPGVRNMILVPLRQGRTLYGVIVAFNKCQAGEFASTAVQLVSSLSGTISVSVENSHLYGNLRRLMLGAIKALVSAIDAKDPYTCGHSERVAIISREIARRLKLPVEDVERIYLAGLLHDIGKIGVPERILMKSGQLDAAEFDVIKTHPVIGAKILAGVQELEGVLPGVLHHHEWLDGRGYPNGLVDRALPLDGRIIGLADALDAMTSTRVYRPAIPVAEVEREIRRCTGTQFDGGCVDALLEVGLGPLLDSLPVQHGELDLNLQATGPRRSCHAD